MPVYKDPKAVLSEKALPYELVNMALAGTSIVGGAARGVVVGTGSRTYLASIAEKSKEASPDSPLTKALKSFVKRYVVLLIFVLSALIGIGIYQDRSLIELSYIILASLVSAVPEGLPLVITIVMIVGAVVLSRHKTFVRYLPSVETLGSATIIASDKTGTITAGELVVREVFTHSQDRLRLSAALCNDAHDGAGDPIDIALADWVENGGEIRKEHPRIWTHSFDPELRLMATANKMGQEDMLFVKGAFESLKERSEEKDNPELEKAFQFLLGKGLRVLAFGVGEARSKDPNDWKLQIVGLIGFIDPPKKEVKEAVLSAKEAGIHVIMITGDHPKTAEAVAKDVSIWDDRLENQVLTGVELEALSDEELAKKLEHITVLARILPDHKHRVVKILQDHDQIVAVTGDGVNDVPALKAADLGIAMGSGTEAAKSVSKMVITNNNLGVIITSIKNGRVISDNIRKVIYYLVSTSIQEIVLITLSILFALPLPLTAIQILWINLVTDGFQDKTFAFTKEEGSVMKRKPRKPNRKFLDRVQILRILSFSFGIGVVCFILYYTILEEMEFKKVSTIIFTSVVAAQWANGIQAQKELEPFSINISRSFTINPYIFLGSLGGLLLQLVAIYLLPKLFDTTPMTFRDWKYPLLVFFSSFVFVEIRKYIEFFWKNRRVSFKKHA
jgi:P-type Ca2+ transporter type 2C